MCIGFYIFAIAIGIYIHGLTVYMYMQSVYIHAISAFIHTVCVHACNMYTRIYIYIHVYSCCIKAFFM